MFVTITDCVALVLFGRSAVQQEYKRGTALRAESIVFDAYRVFLFDGYTVILPVTCVLWKEI